MFRFILEIAFIRRVLQLGFVRFTLVALFFGALIAGLVYACVVFSALDERSHSPHVHSHSTY
jgi:hypothetical protein